MPATQHLAHLREAPVDSRGPSPAQPGGKPGQRREDSTAAPGSAAGGGPRCRRDLGTDAVEATPRPRPGAHLQVTVEELAQRTQHPEVVERQHDGNPSPPRREDDPGREPGKVADVDQVRPQVIEHARHEPGEHRIPVRLEAEAGARADVDGKRAEAVALPFAKVVVATLRVQRPVEHAQLVASGQAPGQRQRIELGAADAFGREGVVDEEQLHDQRG